VFLELFDDRPLTEANYLQYVNSGAYAQSMMHALVKNHILQGGGYYPAFIVGPPPLNVSLDPTLVVDLDGNPSTPNPTVPNESGNTPAHSNVRGTIAMALNGSPDSAESQWFVNLADNSMQLDPAKSTVFGKVISDGMDLFDAMNNPVSISNLNADANGDGLPNDPGPFTNVPVMGVSLTLPIIPIVIGASQIDYYGGGSTTNVPAGGLSISTRDAFVDVGATFTGPGRLIVGTGRTLGVRDGISLTQSVLNLGTFAPGLQVGTVTLPSYEQTAEGTLAIQLRGPTIDTQYDRLNVTGQAKMDGNVDVTLLGGYQPAAGSSFNIITAGSLTGTFTADLPGISAGLVWNVAVSGTTMTLTVVAADYNKDGTVDAADYTVWRDNLGKTVTPFTNGDGNGDGKVDATDYSIWRNNYGETAGASSGSGATSGHAVPEPTSLVLLSLVGVALFLGRLRRSARS
jgi:cyclophilin family peptidyl-prolyl cis-trans isomerase